MATSATCLGIPGIEENQLCPALPVFSLASYLNAPDKSSADLGQLCQAMSSCIRETGALVIRDPRANSAENDRFLSLMERYFSQPTDVKMIDVRPYLAHQVGATPSGVEKPRCLKDERIRAQAASLPPEHRPTLPDAADVKWRFFWRVGTRPHATRFEELNAEPVQPAAFPEWREVMDGWGHRMLAAVHTVAEMLARGFGIEADAFTQRMRLGAHLLAPTGTDLEKFGKLGTVFAGYHYDLNFLTIHGRSRYPGLFIWLRDGERVQVKIPEGCLLLQAGKQMEWLTGGEVKCGYHEVICTPDTLKAIELARQEGRPAWRVSSTVFTQIASDEILRPLGKFANAVVLAAYPAILTGEQVKAELEFINLRTSVPG